MCHSVDMAGLNIVTKSDTVVLFSSTITDIMVVLGSFNHGSASTVPHVIHLKIDRVSCIFGLLIW